METVTPNPRNRLGSLLDTRPKTVQPGEPPVTESFVTTPGTYPLVVQPRVHGLLLPEWLRANQAQVAGKLARYGGILFRNFGLHSVEAFQEVIPRFSDQTMAYTQRSSPRSEVAAHIYTSTDHPADQSINMHNELSYAPGWPAKILFFCVKAAASGGETPIADSRQVLARLRAATRDKFRAKGVMYLRNLGGGLGLPWQEVFQTTDKAAAERACRANRMAFRWKDADRLETRWVRPAIVRHPHTGEPVWFNHAFFFNAAALDPVVRATLPVADLPFNTFYGDGSPIESAVIEEVRDAFEKTKSVFAWRPGDLLVLDNLLMAHGRNPFEGERKIVVAMGDPQS